MDRVVHLIEHECDVYVETIGRDHIRIRITEKNPELLSPTDLEIEGNPTHILDALASAFVVLSNMDAIRKEPS